eukprot:2430514-Rhodomonas_salina.2
MPTRDDNMTDVTSATKLNLGGAVESGPKDDVVPRNRPRSVEGERGSQGKVSAKIKEAMEKGRKFYSIEFFPPHTVEGARGLMNRMDRLANLQVRVGVGFYMPRSLRSQWWLRGCWEIVMLGG